MREAGSIHTWVKPDHQAGSTQGHAVNSWKWVTTDKIEGTRVEAQSRTWRPQGQEEWDRVGQRDVGPDPAGGRGSLAVKAESWVLGLKNEFWSLKGWLLFGPTCCREEGTSILPVSDLDCRKTGGVEPSGEVIKASNSKAGEGRGSKAVTGMGVHNVVCVYDTIQFNQAQERNNNIKTCTHTNTFVCLCVYGCVYHKTQGKRENDKDPWGCDALAGLPAFFQPSGVPAPTLAWKSHVLMCHLARPHIFLPALYSTQWAWILIR